MDKKITRKMGLENLRWLSQHPEIKEQKEIEILNAFYATEYWQKAKKIALIKPLPIEFNTMKIVSTGWQQKKSFAMPKVAAGGQMDFYTITSETTFHRTSFGVEEPESTNVMEPSEIDLLIVPGVVFSSKGYRIGFGGGFYDRYLTKYQGATCSLVFSEQIQEQWKPEQYDLPVQEIIIH